MSTNDQPTALQKLPLFCMSRLPTTGEPILIKRGVKGYFPARCFRIQPEQFNAWAHVTPDQEEAMSNGASFGWSVPTIDPDLVRMLREAAEARRRRLS